MTSFRPARVSTGRSGSGADWAFVDGGVVKVCGYGERRFRPRVNPDVDVRFPVNRMLAFRKVGRCIFW